uniref:PIG-L family deacetylase n=1 Tax=Magnetococcus massalia (strain MO-1) TaxID=451514 RepID=A0A1S7LKY2_MAGMO|nr:Protein of unknown function [Candidatus Magnetococcus massalia]
MAKIKQYVKRGLAQLCQNIWRYSAQPLPWLAGHLVVIAPHPDDEILACGGLIAMKQKLAEPVSIIYMTDGEASHPGCCATDLVAAQRRWLSEMVMRELGVGPSALYRLGVSDGNIPAPNLQEGITIVTQLMELLMQLQPNCVLYPHPVDAHTDHRNTAGIVEATIDTMACKDVLTMMYPVWSRYHMTPSDFPVWLRQRPVKLDIKDVSALKTKLVYAYLQPISPSCGLPWSGSLPQRFPDPFLIPYEWYFYRFIDDRKVIFS